MSFSVCAYAKINLTLDVLRKRLDGYHEIETVMQAISLHDCLEFFPAKDIILTVEGLNVPLGEKNLVFQTAVRLREYTDCQDGVHIYLRKIIPVAAGLGGGSTDAAATLQGLNYFWKTGLSQEKLKLLGASLGSDIPFCLLAGVKNEPFSAFTALAKGRGELLTALPPAPRMGVVLVKLPFEVSTAEVYGHFNLEQVKVKPDTRGMIRAYENGNGQRIALLLANVLETVTLKMYPEIEVVKKEMLAAGAKGSLMTGSGPTVFGLTPDLKTAESVANRLARKGREVLVAAFLPL